MSVLLMTYSMPGTGLGMTLTLPAGALPSFPGTMAITGTTVSHLPSAFFLSTASLTVLNVLMFSGFRENVETLVFIGIATFSYTE